MYSPVLSEKAVKTLYRLKQSFRKPMTEIVENLIQKSLCTIDKEFVCRVCVGERNNDCEGCYLAERKHKKKGVENENTIEKQN